MTAHPANLYRALLEVKLRRAEERLDLSVTPAEIEANRQIIIWIRSELDGINRRAA